MHKTSSPTFGEVIFGYNRAQALADGVLIDVSRVAREAGFRCPVALTACAWSDCVSWDDSDTKRQTYQDASGRLWDVLSLARRAAAAGRGDRVPFALLRVPRGGRSRTPQRTVLHLAIGAGDNGEPVITIMQPTED